jgi:integrase
MSPPDDQCANPPAEPGTTAPQAQQLPLPLLDADPPQIEPMSFREFCERVMQHYWGYSQSTVSLVRTVLSILERHYAKSTVAVFERNDISDIIDLMGSDGADVYTRRAREGMLCKILRLGGEQRCLRLRASLPTMLRTDKFPRGERSLPPAPDGVYALMNHLAADTTWRGRRKHALVSIVLLAGMPVTVVLSLHVVDVDLAAKTIWCRYRWRGKSHESMPPRPARIGDDLVAILTSWIPLTRDEWLITHPRQRQHGRRYTRNGILYSIGPLENACLAAGIPIITWEQLRRFHKEHAAPYLPFPGIANLSSIASGGPNAISPGSDPAVNETAAEPKAIATPTAGIELSPATAPVSSTMSQSPHAAGPLDLNAIADQIAEKNRVAARFLRHFADNRWQTTEEDLIEAVRPGENIEWGTVKSWVTRVNRILLDLGLLNRLSFRSSNDGFFVYRNAPSSG